MTEIRVTQAELDLCVELNVPEYEAPAIARYRDAVIAAVLQDLEAPSAAVEALQEIYHEMCSTHGVDSDAAGAAFYCLRTIREMKASQ